MRRVSFFGNMILAMSLVACGPSAKQTPDAGGGRDSGQQQKRNCEGDYSPIGLYLPDHLQMSDPDSLPPGTYESRGVEIYVRDEPSPATSVQVHFNEILIGESPMLHSVCQGGPKPVDAVEYTFPALQLLVVSATGKSRVDTTYLIQGQRGRFTAGKVNATQPEATGLSGLLAKFSRAALYQTGPTTYELHGEIRELLPSRIVSRWVLQRIALANTR